MEKNGANVGIFNVTMDLTGRGSPPTAADYNPKFGKVDPVRLADISDGTSNTAAFSETLLSGLPSNTLPHPNHVYKLTGAFPLDTPKLPDCNTWTSALNNIHYRGHQYFRALPSNNNYNHTVPPNYKRNDCFAPSFVSSHIAARSRHTGGVNASFCDGSVKFIKDTISLGVWRALGSRAGAEIASSDQY